MRIVFTLILWLLAALGLAAAIDMSGLYDVPMIEASCDCMGKDDA